MAATSTEPGASEHRRSLALAAAGISFGAALIHVAAAPSHFVEYWPFGVFFVVVAALQLGWAETVRRRPDARPLLLAGAAGNLVIVGIWLVSRTVGLPLGPDAGEPEPIGLVDLVATIDQLAIAVIVAILTWGGERIRSSAWAAALAWFLLALSLVAALGNGDAHDETAAAYLPALFAT